ncbi:MAG: metallophosphoesterase [Planctomycetes bacterium]|nr:metallophosphoesterase [Planctomycetota bacterium]
MKLADIDHLGAAGVARLLGAAAQTMQSDPKRRGSCVHLEGEGRLLATGDLHDNPVHFVKVVAFAQLEQPENHLVLHELIHGDRLTYGVDMSWRMLAKVARLIEKHPGQVHVLLANHELAQAFNQPVSKGAGENTELFRGGLRWTFGEDAEIVEEAVRVFVRAMPLALRTRGGILCSHSLPSPYDMKSFDMGILERDLQEPDYEATRGSAWQMTWGRNQKPEQVAALAKAWGVKVFISGHAMVPEGAAAPNPGLLLLNTDHEHGAVLPIQLSSEVPSAQELLLHAVPISSIEGSLVD